MLFERRKILPMLAGAAGFAAPADRFYGNEKIRRRATGFFRVEQVRGRWLLITPDGRGYLALGANHVGAFVNDAQQSAPLLARVGGDRARAEEELYQAMLAMGLTAGEAYAPLLESLKRRMPHVQNVTFPFASKFAFDVFDPAVQAKLREHTVKECAAFAQDPWVIGVAFADLPVWDEKRTAFYRQLPENAPGRQRFQAAQKRGLSDDEFLGEVAATLYGLLRTAVREGAPHHLFLGERFVLRLPPEPVVRAVGREIDVFSTQALILSPRRPPEWQVFQADGYRHTYERIGRKPMLIIDWAAPFSLDETYETERGTVKNERAASDDAARFLEEAFAEPYIVGVFKCQLAGWHGNDRWFPEGRMKRTYLRDDGTPYPYRTGRAAQSHRRALEIGFAPVVK